MKSNRKALVEVLRAAEYHLQRSLQCPLDELSAPLPIQDPAVSQLVGAVFSHRKAIAILLQHFQRHFCTVPRAYRSLCHLLVFLIGFAALPIAVLRRFIVQHPLRSATFVRCIFEMMTDDTERVGALLRGLYEAQYVQDVILTRIETARPGLSQIVAVLNQSAAQNPVQDCIESRLVVKKEEDFVCPIRTRLPPFIDLPLPFVASEHRLKRIRFRVTKASLPLTEPARSDSVLRMYSSCLEQYLHGSDQTWSKTKSFKPALNAKPWTCDRTVKEGATKVQRLQVLDEIRRQRELDLQQNQRRIVARQRKEAPERDRRFDPTLPSKSGEGLFPQMTYFELKQRAILQKKLYEVQAEHQQDHVRQQRTSLRA